MTGIGGVSMAAGASGATPGASISGLGGDPSNLGGSLNGMSDLGLGDGNGGGLSGTPGGMGPNTMATDAQGSSFSSALREIVIENPSASRAYASDLGMRFAAGDTTIDPHQLSIASAKAGVEIQMSTRTISSAVSAVRTLFQMQV